MKKFFRRLATYIVTAYANIIYNKATDLATKRYSASPRRYYVLSHPTKARKLLVLTAKEFQRLRRQLCIPTGTVDRHALEKQSWYYTEGKGNQTGINPKDGEIRRLAFIRDVLKKANLL